MKIILNTNPEEFNADSMTIRQLLDEKKFSFKLLIIKVNGILVKKDQYEATIVKHGDKVDVIHLMSGG
ncbi:MAG: sulfur carrier protein ThiS [Bacteroidota bacterium]